MPRQLTFKDAADAYPYAAAIAKQQNLEINTVMEQLGALFLQGKSWQEAAESLGYLPSCVLARPGEIIVDPLHRWPDKIRVPIYLYRGGPGGGAPVLAVALTEKEAKKFGPVRKYRFIGGKVAIDWRNLVTWHSADEYSASLNACSGLGCDLILPAPDMRSIEGFNYSLHAIVCNPKCLEETNPVSYDYEDDPLNHKVKLIGDYRFGMCYQHTWDISPLLATQFIKQYDEEGGVDLKKFILEKFKRTGIIPLDVKILDYGTAGPAIDSPALRKFWVKVRS